ncbi:hypothetical protein D3C72_900390 [compost metagenome]
MMRTAALCASLLILTSCAKLSSPGADGAVPPAAKAIDPRLCAPLEAEPSVAGSIVGPVTPTEVDATREHLTSDAEARAWGRRGWARADLGRASCPPGNAGPD